MIIHNNHALDSLTQYLSTKTNYEVKEIHMVESVPEFARSLPEFEDFRVIVPYAKGSLDDAVKSQTQIIDYIRDFYEIEHGGSYNDHGNGAMIFTMPKGVISVVTTATIGEIRVSATNYCSEYVRR